MAKPIADASPVMLPVTSTISECLQLIAQVRSEQVFVVDQDARRLVCSLRQTDLLGMLTSGAQAYEKLLQTLPLRHSVNPGVNWDTNVDQRRDDSPR
ncbi:hypothetical protein [Phytoactinopolyspora limicola]|uniref:hypothetical protein n=1 Tax=Phytoactinopolyspora limicola TaxID=2715536 RepID=UPI00140BAA48|nr:hypothetical protein [Phytoactinopolyspora limicola]